MSGTLQAARRCNTLCQTLTTPAGTQQAEWHDDRRWRACCTSAPVASHSAEMVLTEEMRCASIALAVSLDSSALHRLVHRMRSSGTQCWYTLFSTASARCPLSVSFPPISTCAMRVRSHSNTCLLA